MGTIEGQGRGLTLRPQGHQGPHQGQGQGHQGLPGAEAEVGGVTRGQFHSGSRKSSKG